MNKTAIEQDHVCAFSRVLRRVGMTFMRVAGQNSSVHTSFSKQELLTLGMIGMQGACKMGDIAAVLGVGQSAVTPLIDRLEQAGLVERRRSVDDRRVWLVGLTHAGQKVAAQEDEVYQQVAVEMLGALKSPEQAQLIQLMERVSEGLDA